MSSLTIFNADLYNIQSNVACKKCCRDNNSADDVSCFHKHKIREIFEFGKRLGKVLNMVCGLAADYSPVYAALVTLSTALP